MIWISCATENITNLTQLRVTGILFGPRSCLPWRAFRSLTSVMLHGGVGHNFNQFHHAPVFVSQDVAMQHILAGEVGKARAHDEVAGNRERAGGGRARSTLRVFL